MKRQMCWVVIILISIIFTGCTGMRTIRQSDKCPLAGSEVPFVKLMNPGFADDYVGCDVVTTAQFVASGPGLYVLSMSLKDKVVFRALPPGATGEKNPLSGEITANYVAVPKAISNLVFELQPGDLVKLRGGNHVSSVILAGSYREVVFVATSIERVNK